MSTKFQSLIAAGIEIPGARSKKLSKNYRNSKEILSAAHTILINNLTEELLDSEDFEVLDPEYSDFFGPVPLILDAPSLEKELAYAIAFAKSEINEEDKWKVCIAICGYSLHELNVFGKENKFVVLDGETSLSDSQIFVSDLEQSKGFEFDIMIVVNASMASIPNPVLPAKEHFREMSQFYVALTRAKSQLIVSFNGEASNILDGTDEVFAKDSWSKYCPDLEIKDVNKPKKIGDLMSDSYDREELVLMSGAQFLYSDYAIGLSSRLISNIRDLIPGKALSRQGYKVKWKNIGSAYDSVENSARSRLAFGREVVKEFRSMCTELNIPECVRKVGKEKKD